MTDVVEGAELSRDALTKRMEKTGAIFRDESGRVLVLERAAVASEEEAFRQYLLREEPELAELHPGHWVPLQEAEKRFPNRCVSWIRKVAPSVSPGAAVPGPTTSYVWLGPNVVSSLSRTTLEDAVAALDRPGLDPKDFIRRTELFEWAEEKFGLKLQWRWPQVRAKGAITEVKAHPPFPGPMQCFVHFSDSMREATTADELLVELMSGSERT